MLCASHLSIAVTIGLRKSNLKEEIFIMAHDFKGFSL
jgi:hypothetical protein